MGDAFQLSEGVLNLSPAPEVGQVRFRVRVSDADVDYPSHVGVPGGVERHPGLLHALSVGAPPVVHPGPVGVEQGVGAAGGLPEHRRVFEVELVEPHPVSEGVLPAWVPRDRLDLVSQFQESAGDVATGVAGCSGYRVLHFLVHLCLVHLSPCGVSGCRCIVATGSFVETSAARLQMVVWAGRPGGWRLRGFLSRTTEGAAAGGIVTPQARDMAGTSAGSTSPWGAVIRPGRLSLRRGAG